MQELSSLFRSPALAGAAFLLAFGSYIALAFDVGLAGVIPGVLLGGCLALFGLVLQYRRDGGVLGNWPLAAAIGAAFLAVAAACMALGGYLAVAGPLVALAGIVAAWFAL